MNYAMLGKIPEDPKMKRFPTWRLAHWVDNPEEVGITPDAEGGTKMDILCGHLAARYVHEAMKLPSSKIIEIIEPIADMSEQRPESVELRRHTHHDVLVARHPEAREAEEGWTWEEAGPSRVVIDAVRALL